VVTTALSGRQRYGVGGRVSETRCWCIKASSDGVSASGCGRTRPPASASWGVRGTEHPQPLTIRAAPRPRPADVAAWSVSAKPLREPRNQPAGAAHPQDIHHHLRVEHPEYGASSNIIKRDPWETLSRPRSLGDACVNGCAEPASNARDSQRERNPFQFTQLRQSVCEPKFMPKLLCARLQKVKARCRTSPLRCRIWRIPFREWIK
jgi:hypothetical protein